MLSRMVLRRANMPGLRFFSKEFVEPLTIKQLQDIGHANASQDVIVDYESLYNDDVAVSGKIDTFKSLESQINSQFQMTPSEAADRNSKRCGLLGYKMGMTHFWDRWGVLTPCTVIQVDRC